MITSMCNVTHGPLLVVRQIVAVGQRHQALGGSVIVELREHDGGDELDLVERKLRRGEGLLGVHEVLYGAAVVLEPELGGNAVRGGTVF